MIKKYFNINFTPMRLLFGDVKFFDDLVLNNDFTFSNEDKPIALHYVKASRMDDYYQKYK
jgi:hypothetical protein